MQTNAILVHGTSDKEEYFSDKFPSLSNSHWLPWIQKQLLINGVLSQTPEMPYAYQPNYNKWKEEFDCYLVNENTILIGHSCGGGFLLRWLSENTLVINKLILVAPWLDPDRSKTDSFFDFRIDPKLRERVKEIHLLVSSDDDQDVLSSVQIIKRSLPKIITHQYINKGHFISESMGTNDFPELLNIVLQS